MLELPPAVVVPADAIVASGLGEAVYVARAHGAPELRAVPTGWRTGDRVQVVEGVAPGASVLTAGTFLLDSEARMRSPASGIAEAMPNGT